MKLAINDSGKFQNKGIGDTTMLFPTRLTELEAYNSYYDTVVEFEGKFYAIGEGVPDTNVSKKELTHKICTLYAITQMFEKIDYMEDVYLVTGSPIQSFDNPAFKQQFKEFMMGQDNGVVNISVNRVSYTFKLVDILILPESCGIIQTQPELFTDNLVGVIDWGGLQANCMIYDKGKPIKSTGFTKQLGGYFIESKLISRLNALGEGRNYQDYEIPYLFERATGEDRDILEATIRKYLDELLTECKQRNWNIQLIDLVFTGGTSQRFAPYIKKRGYKVSNNPLTDNVEGFRRLAQSWITKSQSHK